MIQNFTTKGGIECKIEVPETTEPLPLLIWLHGIKEIGGSVDRVLNYGPLRQIQDGVDLGFKMIIVHPHLLVQGWSEAIVDDVLESCKASFPVDADRIWLGGCSHGGWGVWRYACSSNNSKLAAIFPICGQSNDPTQAIDIVKEGLPGWAAHSPSDIEVPFDKTIRMVNAVNDLAGRKLILFSQYGLFGHTIWGNFLKPEYGLYQWLKYQRLSNRTKPSVITLKPGDQITITA